MTLSRCMVESGASLRGLSCLCCCGLGVPSEASGDDPRCEEVGDVFRRGFGGVLRGGFGGVLACSLADVLLSVIEEKRICAGFFCAAVGVAVCVAVDMGALLIVVTMGMALVVVTVVVVVIGMGISEVVFWVMNVGTGLSPCVAVVVEAVVGVMLGGVGGVVFVNQGAEVTRAGLLRGC